MAYQGGKTASEFIKTEIVQRNIDEARRYVAEEAVRLFDGGVVGCIEHLPSLRFDSPLEVLFWLWWSSRELMANQTLECLDLLQQQEVRIGDELFRVDFLIQPADQSLATRPDWTPIAVEVDGHAFHEKTLEQVAYRNKRDRALQQAGWKVFHFSFSEFTSDPLSCVSEVSVFAWRQWQTVSINQALDSHRAKV